MTPKWFTCPVCKGTGALKVREGSGWRLVTDPRCNGRGTVSDVVAGDELELTEEATSPPYAPELVN